MHSNNEIVNSKVLKRQFKVKHRAPAYSRVLSCIGTYILEQSSCEHLALLITHIANYSLLI